MQAWDGNQPPAAPSGAEPEVASWLAMVRAPGIGPRVFALLREHLGSPGQVLALSARELRALGLAEATCAYLRAPDWAAVEGDLAWAGRSPNRHVITLEHPAYPERLRHIPDPPPVLFLHGDPAALGRAQLAVVGSRNPSPAGRETAREMAAGLSAEGLAVTSGLALGIDAAAHRGALEASGVTIAVAGNGLDRVYPARHRELARAIARQGALVSEFPPGTRPSPGHFPRRNRIISGLSLGVLVVEATPRSGSLITARFAADQGREVFSIPGSIHNPLARGCHALIRDGAKLVEKVTDILDEIGACRVSSDPGQSMDTAQGQLNADEKRLLAALGFDPVCVDTLVERTGLTADVLSSMLSMLELRSHVIVLPGNRYARMNRGT